MNFSNLILVLTFVLSCVHSACSADTEVEIRYSCTADWFKYTTKCIKGSSHFYCTDSVFNSLEGCDYPKECFLGEQYLGPEGRELFAGPVCSNRMVNIDPTILPCSEHTCYAQISPDGTQLNTCGLDCPDYLLTQANSTSGKCEMKTCSQRKPNAAVSPICGAGTCFQQINPSTADLKDICAESCADQNLTTTNLTSHKCQMRTCLDRIPSSTVMKHCGNACYRQIAHGSGVMEDYCRGNCSEPSLVQANNTNGMCELKICGSRVPINSSTVPCGPNCFKQISSATGTTEETCMSLCPDQRLTQPNTALGKCELKPCASRTPNPDVTPSCGPQCVLQEDEKTCLPPVEVDEEDVGGEGGEDEGDATREAKAQAGDDGSSLSNVYLALAVILPVMGVIALISGISCIVMIVMQAKTESKAKRIDVADEEKNVVDQVIEYIEAAAEDAALDPALPRPAPLPRKSMRKSVRGSKRVSAKLQNEEK